MNEIFSRENELILYPSVAKKAGVVEAIIFSLISDFIEVDGYQDGDNVWIKLSQNEINEIMPFVSIRTIQRSLKKLEDIGLIVSGLHRDHPFDSKLSYAVNYGSIEDILSDNMS